MKRYCTALILICMSLAANCLTSSYAHSQSPDSKIMMRVSILDDKAGVKLYIKDPYRIRVFGSDKTILEGPRIATRIVNVKDGLMIYDKVYKVSAIRLTAKEEDSRVCIDNKLYRGEIDIIKKENGKLLIVNIVSLDEYLYGVLYHEVSHRWPMEALKAQAIAARTFALYQASQNKTRPYDLRSDVYSQVYGGSDFEKWSTTRAVDATKGRVLVYGGSLLPAYYHAACAGRTEDAAALWKTDISPLRGVVCEDCKQSPYYTWTQEIPLWTLENKLKANGYRIDKICAIDIVSRNESGRVEKVQVKDSSDVSIVLTGKDFRQLLGPNELRSTNFDVSIQWGNLVFKGRGWGHGVGMCQWGMYGKAQKGMKAEQILAYYYPGSEITTIDKIGIGK